jgi:hypothetical protein
VLALVCAERKVLLAGWLRICSERKVLLAEGADKQPKGATQNDDDARRGFGTRKRQR